MNPAIQLVVSAFVLVIGEIIIYDIAMASDLPFLLKWLAIFALPVAAIFGIFSRFRR